MPPVRVRDDTFVYFKDHSTGDAWYERDSAEYHRQRLMIISCDQLAALEATSSRWNIDEVETLKREIQVCKEQLEIEKQTSSRAKAERDIAIAQRDSVRSDIASNDFSLVRLLKLVPGTSDEARRIWEQLVTSSTDLQESGLICPVSPILPSPAIGVEAQWAVLRSTAVAYRNLQDRGRLENLVIHPGPQQTQSLPLLSTINELLENRRISSNNLPSLIALGSRATLLAAVPWCLPRRPGATGSQRLLGEDAAVLRSWSEGTDRLAGWTKGAAQITVWAFRISAGEGDRQTIQTTCFCKAEDDTSRSIQTLFQLAFPTATRQYTFMDADLQVSPTIAVLIFNKLAAETLPVGSVNEVVIESRTENLEGLMALSSAQTLAQECGRIITFLANLRK